MSQPNITDEQLLEFLDGNLDEGEYLRVETALKKDSTVLKRLEELKMIDALLSDDIMMAPSINFTSNVMTSINPVRQHSWRLKKQGLFVLLATILFVLAGSILLPGNMPSLSVAMETVTEVNNYIPEIAFNSINIDLTYLSNALLMALAILSLMLIDKLIFKPFFQSRRSRMVH